MILISLVFLFVYLFGAYAYGAATVLQRPPGQPDVGPAEHRTTPRRSGSASTRPSLALFAISTVWFVLHIADRVPQPHRRHRATSWLDLGTLHRLPVPAGDHAHGVSASRSATTTRRRRRSSATCWARCTCSRRSIGVCIGRDDLPAGAAARRRSTPWIGISDRRAVHARQHLLDGADAAPASARPRTPDQLRLRNVMIFAVHRAERRVHRADLHARAAAARA